MRREAVESTAIAAVGYDAAITTLEIEFTNATVYQYPEVSQRLYHQLMAADSLGRFHAAHLRDLPYVRIDHPTDRDGRMPDGTTPVPGPPPPLYTLTPDAVLGADAPPRVEPGPIDGGSIMAGGIAADRLAAHRAEAGVTGGGTMSTDRTITVTGTTTPAPTPAEAARARKKQALLRGLDMAISSITLAGQALQQVRDRMAEDD